MKKFCGKISPKFSQTFRSNLSFFVRELKLARSSGHNYLFQRETMTSTVDRITSVEGFIPPTFCRQNVSLLHFFFLKLVSDLQSLLGIEVFFSSIQYVEISRERHKAAPCLRLKIQIDFKVSSILFYSTRKTQKLNRIGRPGQAASAETWRAKRGCFWIFQHFCRKISRKIFKGPLVEKILD